MFRREGPLRRLLRERAEKGPVLRRLREEFFRASSRILDFAKFEGALSEDIGRARAAVVIFSPFLKIDRVKLFLSLKDVQDALKRGVRMVVITRPARGGRGGVGDPREHGEAAELLRDAGVKVVEVDALHFKAVIIDDEIIYLGSINPLSITPREYYPPDYMVRFASEALVDEIVENVLSRDKYEEMLKE